MSDLIKSLVDEATLTRFEAGEVTQEEVLQGIEQSVLQKHRPSLEQEISDKVRGETVGKTLGELKSQASRVTGMPKSSFDGKSQSEIIAIITDKVSNSTDERLEALKLEVENARSGSLKELQEAKDELAKALADKDNFIKDHKFNSLLYSLKSNTTFIEGFSDLELKSIIDAKLNANGLYINFDGTEPELYNKSTNTPAYSTGTKKLSLKETVDAWITPFKAKAVANPVGSKSLDNKDKNIKYSASAEAWSKIQ